MTEPEQALRILIVEDSMGVARSLSLGLGLSHRNTYDIETCGSGEEALQRLVEAHVDLLISDLRLPGIDGLTLLERTRHFSPTTRSILITAYGSPEVEERARELADAYVPKPFMIQDLLRVVDQVLQEAPTAEEITAVEARAERVAPVVQSQIEQRRSVHLTVFACDLDGTLAEDGQIAPATWDMLRTARAAGIVHVLVTGRTLDSFIATGPFPEVFEAIVAENGAVVHFPKRDRVVLPFGTLAPALIQQWQAMGIPVERGMAIAATVVPHDEAMLRALRRSHGCAAVEYNRNAMMLLPTGATKGSGLLYALEELGYSAHNVLACGDAENDQSLFDVAELGIAVANAMPTLRTTADAVLPAANGAGVRKLLQDLLDGRVPAHRPRDNRGLVLGHRASGAPVRLDPFAVIDTNMGILGSSGSGKSWLAGLLVEELLKQKYQVCIIDPEGDYRALAAAPGTMLLGGPHTPLPPVANVLNVVEWNNVSLVLDLSMYNWEQRNVYLADFLRSLRGLRARRGRPHYFLVDEVQSFCPPEGGALSELMLDAMRWGGFGLVSYRPSLVARSLLEQLDHLLFTRLALPEEIMTLQPWLSRHRGCSKAKEELPTLPRGQAYLCAAGRGLSLAPGAGMVKFRVGARAVPHVRHLHKYLRTPLPDDKRFYFRSPSGQTLGTAASLWEFRERLAEIPSDSLRMHVARGDFNAWVSGVLHDEELARRIDRVARRELKGDTLRQTLEEVVAERYEELEALV